MSAENSNDFAHTFKHEWVQDPEIAKKYANAENATQPFGALLVEQSGLKNLGNEDAHIFDLACGTGAVIQSLYDAVPKENWSQLKILGGDVSPGMLEYLNARKERQGWTGLETRIIDGNVRFFP